MDLSSLFTIDRLNSDEKKFLRLLCPSANKDAKVLILYSYGDTSIQMSRVYYFYEVFRKESLVFFRPGIETSVGTAVNGKGSS